MGILNDEENIEFDFLNMRESVPLPPKPFTSPVDEPEERKGFAKLSNNFYAEASSPSHDIKDKIVPLPPITSSGKHPSDNLDDDEDPTEAWSRVSREDVIGVSEMTMDDEQWCKWLRSSKPASTLPKLHHSFMGDTQ